jgi:prepilin-type processing-associated H-X9-DG protein
LTNGEWHAFPISSAEVADKGRTIIFIDSLWDRSSSGVPYGGGSWVVVPPCRYKEGGAGGRTDTFHLPAGTEYFFGFNPEGWQPQSAQSGLVYGGAWPWHRKRFNLLYADGRAATVQLTDLVKGCNVDRDWLGLIRSSSDYPWDLDE